MFSGNSSILFDNGYERFLFLKLKFFEMYLEKEIFSVIWKLGAEYVPVTQ